MKLNQVATGLGPKIRQKELARAVEVVPRTLRNWSKRTRPEDFPKLGRPAHDERARLRALLKVGREYLRQERCGWRPIEGALKGVVPTRLIQDSVRALKACERRRASRRIRSNQARLEVLAKNALWVHDSAQVGRSPSDGSKIESQVTKDRGPLVTVGISTGATPCASDTVELLNQLKRTRGLPLVWGTDNGSAFACEDLKEYCRREKVVHLRSLPRTPQHNGSAEVGIGELKRCARVTPGAPTTADQAHARMVGAALSLNQNRLRATKGLKSGAELDDKYVDARELVDRDRFYAECSSGIEAARRATSGARATRMAEREAIFKTMERFGLVRWYRGGSQATAKAEIFS